MDTIILIVHVLAAVGVISLVLLQQGKGADMGAAFGSGASSTVFGSQGSSSFITRATAVLATVFFVTSLGLAMISSQGSKEVSVTETVVTEEVDSEAPVAEDMPSAPEAPAMEATDDMPAAPADDMPAAPEAEAAPAPAPEAAAQDEAEANN